VWYRKQFLDFMGLQEAKLRHIDLQNTASIPKQHLWDMYSTVCGEYQQKGYVLWLTMVSGATVKNTGAQLTYRAI